MIMEKTMSRYSVRTVISIVLAAVVALSVFGCAGSRPEPTAGTVMPASPEECITQENKVFYYYEAVVATVGGDTSSSYELYKYTDTELILVRDRPSPDSGKEMYYCIVPASVLDDCMKVVKKYKMGKGKWLNGDGIVGMVFAVGFLKDGEFVRVSSECMPDNGIDAFDAVRKVLSEAWSRK